MSRTALAALRAGRDDRVNRLRLPLPSVFADPHRDRLRSRSDKPHPKAPRETAKDNDANPMRPTGRATLGLLEAANALSAAPADATRSGSHTGRSTSR